MDLSFVRDYVITCDQRMKDIFVDCHVLLLHELQDGRCASDVAHGAVAGYEMLVCHAIRHHSMLVFHPEFKKRKMLYVFSFYAENGFRVQ